MNSWGRRLQRFPAGAALRIRRSRPEPCCSCLSRKVKRPKGVIAGRRTQVKIGNFLCVFWVGQGLQNDLMPDRTEEVGKSAQCHVLVAPQNLCYEGLGLADGPRQLSASHVLSLHDLR